MIFRLAHLHLQYVVCAFLCSEKVDGTSQDIEEREKT